MSAHPFREAFATRNLDSWVAALSEDVVLRSPITRSPFAGRERARELYGVLFEVLERVEITRELTDGEVSAFYWTASASGRRIEGTDLVHTRADGQIDEITVMIRPLVAVAAFAAAVGPPLAARRSPALGALMRLVSLPLRPLFTAIDLIAGRLA